MQSSGLRSGRTRSDGWWPSALALAAIMSSVVAFVLINRNGYGENLDNYTMLRAWQVMVAQGTYIPSRFQGNLPSELALGYLASWFGPTGANALSFVLSFVALGGVWALFRPVNADRVKLILAVLTIGLNPFWVNAASTSMDYIHPIGLTTLGVLCLWRNAPVMGALLLAVAAGCRLSYVPIGLACLLVAAALETDRRQRIVVLQSCCVYLAVTGLIYLPVFISAHLSFGFLGSASPNWQGLPGLIVRAVYKTLYLYGLPGSLLIAGYCAMRLFGRRGIQTKPAQSRYVRIVEVLCWATLIYHSLLFFYIPIRIEYLLPSLIAVAGLCLVRDASRAFTGALVVAELIYWFVSIDLLRVEHRYEDPCAAVQAVGASLQPHPAPGVLLHRFEQDTIEAACMPIRLLERPSNIHDRLPRPAPPAGAP